jgi:hypothetical protein
MEIVDDYLGQIGRDLDRARVYNLTMYVGYSDADMKLIAEDRRAVLGGHTTAASALTSLINEIHKPKPDFQTIKTLTTVIFDGATRAAAAHREVMRKLGIPQTKTPSA